MIPKALHFLDQPSICPDSCPKGANNDVYTGRRPLSVAGLACTRGNVAEGLRSPSTSTAKQMMSIVFVNLQTVNPLQIYEKQLLSL